MGTDEAWLDQIAWGPDGLVPAIAQDAHSGRVLMVAWMNREALRLTRKMGRRSIGRVLDNAYGIRAKNPVISSACAPSGSIATAMSSSLRSSKSGGSPVIPGASAVFIAGSMRTGAGL